MVEADKRQCVHAWKHNDLEEIVQTNVSARKRAPMGWAIVVTAGTLTALSVLFEFPGSPARFLCILGYILIGIFGALFVYTGGMPPGIQSLVLPMTKDRDGHWDGLKVAIEDLLKAESLAYRKDITLKTMVRYILEHDLEVRLQMSDHWDPDAYPLIEGRLFTLSINILGDIP